jgi:hypothetical protein
MLEIGDTCAGLFDQVRSVPGPIQSPDTRLWGLRGGTLAQSFASSQVRPTVSCVGSLQKPGTEGIETGRASWVSASTGLRR